MKKTNMIIAAGVGFAAGYLAKQQVDTMQKMTPEKALKQAKEAFKKEGPINGSWIYMKPEQFEKNGLLYEAYRGGVTRNIDGKNIQYEFHLDADTGAIIESREA
ncbi:PepSY domain-containing protein [Aciduricibacillus chroicocephali]|uniref:PepSY domain-containing protein n=1 Tax=Aciduricibacillus chroicocephali TaxID=3054939 RepID=A0ABY9KSM7_9BACI|nr:PepSY domain-containing protein [Bacillaceae bacterium 44XB]